MEAQTSRAGHAVPVIDMVTQRLGDLVPRDALRVIEICRNGESVAARARLWNPAVRFLTITWDGVASLDLGAILRQQALPFDAIILHDVAGGSAQPFAFFTAALPYLKPGAAMLGAVPNLRYWRNLDKASRGLTLGGIKSGLDACRLIPDQAVPVYQPEDQTPESKERIEVLAHRHKFVPSKLGASHFIVRAVSSGQSLRRLLVQAITLKPVGACNDTRIDQPLAFLSTIPGVRTTSNVDRLIRPDDAPKSDRQIALVQRRMLVRSDVQEGAKLIKLGYLTISEFDDLPTRWSQIAEHDNLTFRAVHAVQTSTAPLAEYFSTLTPEVEIFSNQIAAVPPRRTARAEGVRIFFGAFNREEDWRDLMASINAIIATSQVPVSFDVVHDRGFFDALETDRKTFTPTCDYARYTAVLRRCDIALLPLTDNEFNRAKSDLKFIECAIHEVAVLASPVVYSGTIRNGENGFLFATPQEFLDRLTLLVGDATVRREITEEAYEYACRERLLAQHFRRRYEWFLGLLARKTELDAKLRERVPGLFQS